MEVWKWPSCSVGFCSKPTCLLLAQRYTSLLDQMCLFLLSTRHASPLDKTYLLFAQRYTSPFNETCLLLSTGHASPLNEMTKWMNEYDLKCVKCSNNFQIKEVFRFLAVSLIPPTVLCIVVAVFHLKCSSYFLPENLTLVIWATGFNYLYVFFTFVSFIFNCTYYFIKFLPLDFGIILCFL